MDRAFASRALTRVARVAGITRPISRTACDAPSAPPGWSPGISIRDMQYAMRHADPRITMRYDMAKARRPRRPRRRRLPCRHEHRLTSHQPCRDSEANRLLVD